MAIIDALWPMTRAVLFRMDPEEAHERTLKAAALAGKLPGILAALTPGPCSDPRLARTVAGVPWRGPVGLAAGLDKDGRALALWPLLGFGAVEVGTVTAHPQPGNDRPRLFRYPEQAAIINRMGFNNRGSLALAETLRAHRERGSSLAPIGANVGKSKITPNEEAPSDYATSISRLRGLCDWFTVNVSSPNTPGLRDLQAPEQLVRLLDASLRAAGDTPLLLKLAPDLADEDLARAVEVGCEAGVSGFIATNTTLSREGFSGPGEAGGLSGRPLRGLSRHKIGIVLQAARKRPVIGAGGVESAEQVQELLSAGCAAVQLYSALVFRGPGLPSSLHRAIAEAL